jgi:hypothetical protein
MLPATMSQDLPTLYPAQAARLRDCVAADGTLTADLGCRRCNYNLRGLRVGGRCPECATPVWASMRGDDLIYADPSWVARLATGARLLAIGWLTAPLSLIVATFSYDLSFVLAGSSVPLMGGGLWLLTQPDPSGGGELYYGRRRNRARWVCLVGCLLPGAILAERELKEAAPRLAGPMWWVSLLVALAALAGLVLLLGYVKVFVGRRMPDAGVEGFLSFTHSFVRAAGAVLVAGEFLVKCVLPVGYARGALVNWLLAVPVLALFIGCLCSVAAVWNVRQELRLRARFGTDLWPGRVGAAPAGAAAASTDNPEPPLLV